jgi:hypothetical protein
MANTKQPCGFYPHHMHGPACVTAAHPRSCVPSYATRHRLPAGGSAHNSRHRSHRHRRRASTAVAAAAAAAHNAITAASAASAADCGAVAETLRPACASAATASAATASRQQDGLGRHGVGKAHGRAQREDVPRQEVVGAPPLCRVLPGHRLGVCGVRRGRRRRRWKWWRRRWKWWRRRQ